MMDQCGIERMHEREWRQPWSARAIRQTATRCSRPPSRRGPIRRSTADDINIQPTLVETSLRL